MKRDYWVIQLFHPKHRKWYCIDNKAYSIHSVACMIRNTYREFGVEARMKKVKTGKVKLEELAMWNDN